MKAKSVKELASFLGISQRHAFRLKKEGVFFMCEGGYDLQACTQGYIKRLKAEKKRVNYERWIDSLSSDERAFYDSFPDFDINDFITPEQQKAWEDELANLPTLSEIMTENMPKKANKRRKIK